VLILKEEADPSLS